MDIMRTNTSNQILSIRRRNYPAEFKADVIRQAQSVDNSVAGVALRYGINPVLCTAGYVKPDSLGLRKLRPLYL